METLLVLDVIKIGGSTMEEFNIVEFTMAAVACIVSVCIIAIAIIFTGDLVWYAGHMF